MIKQDEGRIGEVARAGGRHRVQRVVGRVRHRVGYVVGIAAMAIMGGAAPSFAAVGASTTPPDPTGGAGDSLFTQLTDYLQGHLITAVLGLAVIGIIVGMILAWGRKAAKSK